MSKQDTHFFNVFSLVIGLLVAVAICLFAFARVVASHTQEQNMLVDARYKKNVEEQVQPMGKEAVAGKDNTALAVVASTTTAQASAAAPAMPANGTEVFTQVCSACHGAGIAGAPKAGDHAAWAPRIAKGKNMLYEHALKGFSGGKGMMPPKGGRPDMPDDLIKQAVDHMVEMGH